MSRVMILDETTVMMMFGQGDDKWAGVTVDDEGKATLQFVDLPAGIAEYESAVTLVDAVKRATAWVRAEA